MYQLQNDFGLRIRLPVSLPLILRQDRPDHVRQPKFLLVPRQSKCNFFWERRPTINKLFITKSALPTMRRGHREKVLLTDEDERIGH